MTKETLPALVQETNNIINQIIETDGEDIPSYLVAELTAAELAVSDKIDSYDHIMNRMIMEGNYWKEQAGKYSRVATACTNIAKKLKDNLKFAMDKLKQKELVGNTVVFKLSNSKPRLALDESKLSAEYLIEEIKYTPDKKKIETDLKAGKKVEGAEFINCVSLRSTLNKNR